MRQATEPLRPGPEWVRPGDVRSTFGIGRAQTYNLIRDGKLRSVCIRKPGRAFGMRLVSVASIRDFIERQSAAPSDGNGRTRDYYIELGRAGAKAKAEKAKAQKSAQVA